MKTTVSWRGQAKFEAESGSGHRVLMDGPPEHGGENQGVRPMEMLLMGVGGCASFDVMHILKKSRQSVSSCVVEVDAERVDAVPSVFSTIHLHFKVSGSQLKDSQVKRAVELSAQKYCSASIMLAKGGVAITHSYEIVEQ